MKNTKNRKISIANLIVGYICALMFFFLVLLSIQEAKIEEPQKVNETLVIKDDPIIFDGISPNRVYTYDKLPEIPLTNSRIIREPNVIIENELPLNDRDTVIYGHRPNRDLLIDETVIDKKYIGDTMGHSESYIGASNLHRRNSDVNEGIAISRRDKTNHNKLNEDVDVGLLDRRLAELDKETALFEEFVEKDRLNRHDKIGFREHDDEIDMSNITLARDNDTELGEIDLDFDKNNGKGYGVGKGGELYAYNYPSRGVGAGIGSSAIGAGAGGGAGLGAGIGEGMLNGEVVPTLGGVGTGAAPLEGQPADAPPSGGVGGLIGGAGAGGAAGLTQGYITEKLGLGGGIGQGTGYGGRAYNYDHLPKNGALHIMIHVDGSGSILATRKQLDIMKDTLLKEALLPYYNNDENLYNKRVSIIDDSGERSLQFFKEASKKDNVLAIAFQDEAAPDYHLPNFNKKPQDAYSHDLSGLKSGLNGYNGLYRGIMFQVDRGRVFSKSFKEMVECAWNGEGYLSKENLKKYHRDNNLSNIKNKQGIVFSDEYHARSEGDPQYYLDLIFKASKRVGLDLNIYSAGLKDGIFNEK